MLNGDKKKNLTLNCTNPSTKIYTEVTSQRNLKNPILLYEGDKVDKRKKAQDFQTSASQPLIAIIKNPNNCTWIHKLDLCILKVTCEVKSSLGTNNLKIKFKTNEKIKCLIKNCGLLPQNVTSIKNNGQEYRCNMEKLIVEASLYEPFKIGKVT